MVQDVKELEPQFHSLAFADLKVPRQTAVHTKEPWSDQGVISCITERTSSVRYECLGIDPLQRVRVSDVRRSHHVRPVLPFAGERSIHAGPRGERKPAAG